MTEESKTPETLDDNALADVTGGGEYLAPGVYVEEVSFKARETGRKPLSTTGKR